MAFKRLQGRMTVRERKVVNDVRARKGRAILASATIFISVLGMVAQFTIRDLISGQLAMDIQQEKLSMVDVFMSVAADAAIENDLYLATLNRENTVGEQLAGLEGISRAEGWMYAPINFRHSQDSSFSEGELRAYASQLQDVEIEPMQLLDGGAWPQAGAAQVVLEQRMAAEHEFEIGDEIVLALPGASDAASETFLVTGLVFHPYSFRQINATGGFRAGPQQGIYMQPEAAQALRGSAALSRLVFRYDDFALVNDSYNALQEVILETTPYVPVAAIIDDPAVNTQINNAANISAVLTVLAFVTLGVAGFLIFNIISTIMAEQKQQIGALKSIGASGRDVFFIYANIAFVYGLIGTLPALPLGIITGQLATKRLAPLLDMLFEGFGWSPQAVLLGAVLGPGIPVLASVWPIYRGTRITILEALNDFGIDMTHGNKRMADLIGAAPLPTGIRHALGNVFKKRRRLALTSVSLTLAISAFMGILGASFFFGAGFDKIFTRLGHQIVIIPEQLEDIETVAGLVQGVEGVRAISPGVIVVVQVEGEYTSSFNYSSRGDALLSLSFDPAMDVFHFDLAEGTGWEDDTTRSGAIISEVMANALGLANGDSITFMVGGQRVDQEVIGIERDNFLDQLSLPWWEMAQLAGLMRGGPQPNEYVVEAMIPGRNETVPIIGLSDAALALIEQVGLGEQQLLVTTTLAAELGLAIDDSVELMIGDYDGEHSIAGIVDIPLQFRDQIPDGFAINFRDLVQITGAETNGEPAPNSYFVILEDGGASAQEVDAIIADVTRTLSAAGIKASYQNQVALAEEVSSIIGQVTAILLVAALLITAVGAVALTTTLTISVFERQREIGIMRVIGASSATIAIQFLTEGIVIGLMSWVLALPLGYLLGDILVGFFGLENVAFRYPTSVLVLSLVSTLVLMMLASLGPSLNAARKTVADVIRYQ